MGHHEICQVRNGFVPLPLVLPRAGPDAADTVLERPSPKELLLCPIFHDADGILSSNAVFGIPNFRLKVVEVTLREPDVPRVLIPERQGVTEPVRVGRVRREIFASFATSSLFLLLFASNEGLHRQLRLLKSLIKTQHLLLDRSVPASGIVRTTFLRDPIAFTFHFPERATTSMHQCHERAASHSPNGGHQRGGCVRVEE
mmetsp:Transcript_6631/g.19599  ORF Transcript_6631/g.19599 Transcript_6631/m.19599 type:complete len:200 (+) Transcript_6631:1397-1996(+)